MGSGDASLSHAAAPARLSTAALLGIALLGTALLGVAPGVLAVRAASAQGAQTAQGAQSTQRARDPRAGQVSNLAVGNAAVVVKSGRDHTVYVGASSPTRTVALVLLPTAVDQFVADARTVLLAPRTLDRAVLNDKSGTGSVSLSRVTTKHRATYHFFFSDDPLTGFALPATPAEVRSVMLALHRAARAATARPQQGPSPFAVLPPL